MNRGREGSGRHWAEVGGGQKENARGAKVRQDTVRKAISRVREGSWSEKGNAQELRAQGSEKKGLEGIWSEGMEASWI